MSMFRRKETPPKPVETDPEPAAAAQPAEASPETETQPGPTAPSQVEAMGREVITAMQQVRELLEARALALEACRDALEEHYRLLTEERTQLAQCENDLCGRLEQQQKELDDREAALAERESRLGAEQESVKSQLAALEQDRARFEELKTQHASTDEELKVRAEQLRQQQESLTDQQAAVTRQAEECGKRAAELEQLAATLEARRQELETRQAQLATIQQEWEGRMREVNAVRDSLSALQAHLNQELTRAMEQKTELLPKLGVSEQALAAGAKLDADLPRIDQQARESMERFQKLCRDAKRRAVGA